MNSTMFGASLAAQAMNLKSATGRVQFSEDTRFNGVKVFSATMVADREQLGEKITAWIQANPHVQIREMVVTQSSDEAFHCLAITVFFWDTRSG
jgi:hypothetical protein